ncbi:MAG TPA: PLP-dependent aminotransferase family protein [Steroidobacteraceae bacterium]
MRATLQRLTLPPRRADVSLFRWVYDEIRRAIVDGKLRAGARLPSSRSLARQENVSRGIVVAAFEQLAAEGYIECTVGSGSFVSRGPLEPTFDARPIRHANRLEGSQMHLSKRGQCLAQQPYPKLRSNRHAETFHLDQPPLDLFPLKTWNRIATRRLRRSRPELLVHGDGLGFPPLRAAIASHVASTRGVRCSAEQIVITSGTQQSLDVVTRLLLDPGDPVWVEDPAYPGASALFRALGADVIGIPVDDEGLHWASGRSRRRVGRMVYVTPGCQFPLGITMSLPRRRALLEWARRESAWIFEDDYDGAFCFSGRPLAALQSLDPAGNVIYSNSFNKLLFPALRLAFLVVPPSLVDAVAAAKSVVERFASVPFQAALCDFITEGHFSQHVRRMREVYATRLDTLVRLAGAELSGLLELRAPHGGLQVVGWLPSAIDDSEAAGVAAEHGIDSSPLSALRVDRPQPGGLVLGVTAAGDRAIRLAVTRLGHVLRLLARRNPTS